MPETAATIHSSDAGLNSLGFEGEPKDTRVVVAM